ncbi:MAG: SDR family NAD(P)-dependent oxidoreductase [Verrucomicrobia bacterium]|nr:SDR family NAD(P)-dependent oxidoreductase [Verrucomicrobiota bacterium]
MNISSLNEFTDFKGRSVIVTGASGGIGAGIAKRFAEAGAQVFIHFRSDEAGAAALVHEINDAGGQAKKVYADVSNKMDVEAMFAQISREAESLDVLINNAGNYPQNSIIDMEEEDWDSVINSNLRSTFLCTQTVTKYMSKNKGGSIVNIASIEGQSPTPLHSHYCAAKSGVIMFTRTSANELAQNNIRCNVILPGLIWAEGIEENWPEGVEGWKKAAPLTRLGQAKDVANACLFLSSDAASWITGAELRVDGGVMSNKIF